MASKQVLILLIAAVCAVMCRPTENKEESSIHEHKSIGIVHIRLISDTGIDEVLGFFDPEVLERPREKLAEKMPSSELGKQQENPLDEKKNEPNVERPPVLKEGKKNPEYLEKEREKNPVQLSDPKEKNPAMENPMKEKDAEKLSPADQEIDRRRESSKSPLLTSLQKPKLPQESPDKLQGQKASKDSTKKPESAYEFPAGHPSEPKHSSSEAEKPKPESEDVNLERPKSDPENLNPDEPKEHPEVLKNPEERQQSQSFPSILEPPRVMSKRRRSILDGLPMGDVGMYDERSRYRLPGSTGIQISDDRPYYGMGGGYDGMSSYGMGDAYRDQRYGIPGGMYDDRYGSDTLVDIRMK